MSYAIAIRTIMFLVFSLFLFYNDFDEFHRITKLAVACSNYKPDTSKIVKELSQYQNLSY